MKNNAWDDYPDWIKNGTEASFEEAYEDYVETYEENPLRKDENGMLRHWIEWEYNPDWHWDTYVIGGNKDGKKFQTGPDNYKETALKGEIINLQDLDFAELLNGLRSKEKSTTTSKTSPTTQNCSAFAITFEN